MHKILIIVNSLEIGGLERVATDLALNLNKDKFEPIFCCLKRKGFFAKQLEKQGIKVYSFKIKYFSGLVYTAKIRKIIKKEKIDIIHSHNNYPLIQGVLASLGLNIIRVHTDHNSFATSQNKIIRLLARLLSGHVNRIIVVANSIKEDWIKKMKINPDKLITIYNGIRMKQFDNEVNIAEEKKQIGLKENDQVIGIIARLSWEKDVSTLIKAFSKVNKVLKNAKLLIIGDGPLRNELKEFSNENIRFFGTRIDIQNLMHVFDVFVLSSLNEGCSRTIIEAMAASKPVVATNVGGNPEIVSNEITGLLVPKKNPEKMAESIIKLLKDKKLREKMGKEGRKRIEKYFTINQQIRSYEEIYNEFLKKFKSSD